MVQCLFLPPKTCSTVNSNSSCGYSFNYSDAIRYLEHVVIRTTLTISGVSGDTSSTSNRGDLYIQLLSPNGTLSTLLPFRMNDVVVNDSTTGAAYSDWPFKSLHFWGENPAGTWKITVGYNGTFGTVIVSNTTAIFYGTSQTPQAVPPACDQACARGCFGTGESSCDVCAPKYYRDVTNLTCTQTCTSGTAANGYCYNPSDRDPVCVRLNPPSSGRGTCADSSNLTAVTVIGCTGSNPPSSANGTCADSTSSTAQLMVNGLIVMMVATLVMFL